MNKNCTSTLLKQLRQNYNYTIQQVADILGVTKAAVSKWENEGNLGTEHLYELSKLYGVKYSELLSGKLSNEDDITYRKRNYDLEQYDISGCITTKNINDLKLFFEHCNIIKNRFLTLLPKWAKNLLNRNEKEDFIYIKKYFVFDKDYYCFYTNSPSVILFTDEKIEKDFVNTILNRINDFDEDAYGWEISKIYNFKYDIPEDEICESQNLKALEYLLSSYSQIEKDAMLYANLHILETRVINNPIDGISHQSYIRDISLEEIEDKPFFKVIIDSGANALFGYKSRANSWDLEMFNKIDGKYQEVNDSIYDKYQFSNFAGQKFCPVLENWKMFSYVEYSNFIDVNETNKLKDIVNIKNNNPIKYYENLVQRDKI